MLTFSKNIFLIDCERQKKALVSLGFAPPHFDEVEPLRPFPTAKWLLAVYVRDVYHRLPELLAQITSVYGSIVKIDSTKKICKKLQGEHSALLCSALTSFLFLIKGH